MAINDQDLESDPEEEECYRIIEEMVVDVSTLAVRGWCIKFATGLNIFENIFY